MNLSDPTAFNSMPRTVQDAVNRGWKRDVGCTEGFNGNRFILNDDREVILIYDSNGLIAGMATSTRKGNKPEFPSKRLEPYLDDEGDYWTFSTYFTDPKKVCQKSSIGTWLWDGTGDRLVFASKKTSLEIPLKENELNKTFWTQGMCVKSMGMHYWLNLDGPFGKDSKRDSAFPAFLLYNNGKLNAFGWIWYTYTKSPKIEKVRPAILGGFIRNPPDWMFDPEQAATPFLSSLHIYLDSAPLSNGVCQ